MHLLEVKYSNENVKEKGAWSQKKERSIIRDKKNYEKNED